MIDIGIDNKELLSSYNNMEVSSWIKELEEEFGCIHRRIVVDRKKRPQGEHNDWTQEEIYNNRGFSLDDFNTYSVYVKHIPDMYVIDFDMKYDKVDGSKGRVYTQNHEDLQKSPLYVMLDGLSCWVTKTVHGYHFYIFISSVPEYSDQQNVQSDDSFHLDLLKVNNIWEHKDRYINGKPVRLDWSDISNHFDITKMNKKSNKVKARIDRQEKVANGENPSPLPASPSDDDLPGYIQQPRCSQEVIQGYLDRLKPQKRQDYSTWLKIGMILFNNFDGSQVGMTMWDEWSKKTDHYDQSEIFSKWMTFSANRDETVNPPTLKMWANIDTPINKFEEVYKEQGVDDMVRLMNEECIFNRDTNEIIISPSRKKWYVKCKVEAVLWYEKYSFLNKKDIMTNPFNIWCKNIHRREVEEICFEPEVDNPDIFNIWTGYDISSEDCSDYDVTDADPILNHIKEIWCNNDEVIYKYIMCFLATVLQKPATKIGVVICLQGEEGGGKGCILKILEKIMSKKHYAQIADMKDIIGDFNPMLEGKTLINLDEAYWGGAKSLEGRVKNLITETSQIVNKKNKSQYTISCYANYILTTNNEWFAGVSGNGRRHMCAKCNDKYAGIQDEVKEEYFNTLFAISPHCFAKVLYNWDISAWNPRKYPKTQLFQDQVELNFDSVEQFWYNICETGRLVCNPEFDKPWGMYYCYKDPEFTIIKKEGVDDVKCVYYSRELIWKCFQQSDSNNQRKTSSIMFWKRTNKIVKTNEWGTYQSKSGKRFIKPIPLKDIRTSFNLYTGWEYKWDSGLEIDLKKLNDQGWESDD